MLIKVNGVRCESFMKEFKGSVEYKQNQQEFTGLATNPNGEQPIGYKTRPSGQ